MNDQTPKKYGNAPDNLGLLDLSPKEMLFWLYCPLKTAGSHDMVIPDNLKQFFPFVEACMEDCAEGIWHRSYVYLTAKNLWVNPENTGQRGGWHCDGFGTDDINYIWCNSEPTIFAIPDSHISFSKDHKKALEEMEYVGNLSPNVTYPLKTILRMDETVLHRVADFGTPGMRAFLKLSVSRHPYNLAGNSINHGLVMDWDYADRGASRNSENAGLNDTARG